MNLTNSWMNDPTFLAQSAHFFGALSTVMIASYFWGKKGCLISSAALISIMAIKEFWYDLVYEIPKQSFGDSALDFSFYIIGAVIATGLVLFVKK